VRRFWDSLFLFHYLNRFIMGHVEAIGTDDRANARIKVVKVDVEKDACRGAQINSHGDVVQGGEDSIFGLGFVDNMTRYWSDGAIDFSCERLMNDGTCERALAETMRAYSLFLDTCVELNGGSEERLAQYHNAHEIRMRDSSRRVDVSHVMCPVLEKIRRMVKSKAVFGSEVA